MIERGVPEEFRDEIWPKLMKNTCKVNQNLFQGLKS